MLSDRVKYFGESQIREMTRLAKNFPKGISWDVPYDTSRFVEISIRERDPWAHPITHPALAEDPEIILPVPCSARKPAEVVEGEDSPSDSSPGALYR